ncbi:putative amino acid ABC transporter substrate-binding protein [Salinisphaera hydrothermalis C41B8]|uniref:Putative amino acid ABC transporter substrate-binding protein n=2 Tax=Salinisphaera TaxID=180541 RepID=A0A084IPW0_SALHC|nr:putative amino acid ABC transporter substrate-binding protein [Salinisphaera hydrothermalis C41B8]
MALCLLSLGLGACSQQSGDTVDGIHLVHQGKLTVCTHLPYKPFEFTNDSGKVVGFDVDLVRLLANDLGVKLDVVSMDWNQITSGAAFAAHKCDLAMGGATITAARKKAVQFSAPYFKATQALLVDRKAGVSSLADMANKRLGMQTDTTGEVYAKKHAAQYHYTPVVFDDLALMTTAVSAGKVAAAIGDNGPMAYYAAQNPGTRVAETFDTGERYGFIAAKDSDNADKLIGRLNDVLAKARKNGTYASKYQHWFGHKPTAGSP